MAAKGYDSMVLSWVSVLVTYVKLRLRRQPLQVLAILLEHADDVWDPRRTSRADLVADTFVDFDRSLHNAIARIR